MAAAILTGDRSGIPQDTLEDLRRSNLAHLLAISGLHMGLLTGVVFGGLRFALALIPWIALRWPIKKVAAVRRPGGRRLLPCPVRRARLGPAGLCHGHRDARRGPLGAPGHLPARRGLGGHRGSGPEARKPVLPRVPDVVRGDHGAGGRLQCSPTTAGGGGTAPPHRS